MSYWKEISKDLGTIKGGRSIDIQFERYSSSSTTATSDDFYNLFPTNVPVISSFNTSHGGAICVMKCRPRVVTSQGSVYPGKIIEACIYFANSNPTGSIVDNSGLINGVDLTKITESTDPPAYPIRFYSDTVTEV